MIRTITQFEESLISRIKTASGICIILHMILSLIDLVTVFDAILASRQTREKLQCLYENLISNNFRTTAVLKKI